ncbi:D-alanyl-lipoteichoic acid biosynthesis protein DltB [Paenibacillus filicis]|uniref:Teichoic acid D-alanyltransferase n=1 Tax=Paenibacillus gyeongsangnamensis TaxID=3388067 RepID=A0ABT4Q8D6_9BACL|nr:D-alanyl-lipoteichoic acid biosynthesis protein DltB [Paenibacillus filicis]MCZ8513051.1 D-alanyl-lipoteichoic acid biosynthesis protein DltB [Paenibacillus filicis]
MIPYASLDYFLWAAYILLPGMLLRWLFRKYTWPLLIITAAFLAMLFWNRREELYFLAGYTIWQGLLIWGYTKVTKKRADWYYGSVVLSLLPLVWVKLVPVLHFHSFAGFLGISYLSFKCIQMIVEIRDGQLKTFRLADYLNFLLFFPTISAGPIDRRRRFVKDAVQTLSAKEYGDLIYQGIDRLFRGFLYKFIAAYLIQTYWLGRPLLESHTFSGTMSYMYAYSFYLFFDFAGYSAFAVGFSYLLGIRTPENFNKPFLSRNIKDFWNRWHMTLSFWFRDYVYMRLVLLLTRKHVFPSKLLTSYIGYAALFGLMGLWHGLELHYIVYGIYHAVLMIAFDVFDRFNKRRGVWKDGYLTRFMSTLVTFHAVCFGFLIFSGKLF